MTRDEVFALYRSLLGREPESDGHVEVWQSFDWSAAARLIAGSPEAVQAALPVTPFGSRAVEVGGMLRGTGMYVSTRPRAEGVVFDETGFYSNLGFLKLRSDLADVMMRPAGMIANFDRIRSAHHLDGSFVSAFDGNSFNYYHWTCEGMLTAFMARQLGIVYRCILPIPRNGLAAWQREYLDRTGLLIHEIDGEAQDAIHVDELAWTLSPDVSLIPSETMRVFSGWLRKCFGVTSQRRRRLYVRRRAGIARSIVNDQEVSDYLTALGFHAVVLEDMTVQEQSEAFGSASTIVAPHGAGLANAVFAGPETRVIELVPATGKRAFFDHLFAKLGLEHTTIVCRGLYDDYDSPMVVDISALQSVLHPLTIRAVPSVSQRQSERKYLIDASH